MKKNRETLEFFKADTSKSCLCPLFTTPVQAGFPSPAEDHIEQSLDLNHLLIKHPAATFFVRVQGDSMKHANIHSGDILVVDRALEPKDRRIVIAVVNGEFTVKRVRLDNDALYLMPENPDYPPLRVDADSDFQIWGVVTSVIHQVH